MADSYIRTRGAGQSAGTITVYNKAKRNLIDCFSDVDVTTILAKGAREFWRWLIEEGNSKSKPGQKLGLSENTAKQRLRYAIAFFDLAVEDELIRKNPFRIKGMKTSQSAAEKTYVSADVMDEVIEHCPTNEWKLLFALIRNVPMRIPSEIQNLKWEDVDFEKNTILIHSPKTKSIGKSARKVPLFPALSDYLESEFQAARKSSLNGRVRDLHVFPTLHLHSNLGVEAKRIVLNAKIEPWLEKTWPNFFNSIRASAETDLMDQYGLRRACQWSGNSASTAMKTYALVKKCDFEDVGMAEKVDAKCDAISAVDAKSDAESASTTEQKPRKKSTVENSNSLPCISVGDIGLLLPYKYRIKIQRPQKGRRLGRHLGHV